MSRFKVTEPEVPPPDKPVPAVTPVISPGLAATQDSPLAVAESKLKTYPLVDGAVSATGVEAPLADIKAPLPVRIVLSIKLDVSGATKAQDAPP